MSHVRGRTGMSDGLPGDEILLLGMGIQRPWQTVDQRWLPQRSRPVQTQIPGNKPASWALRPPPRSAASAADCRRKCRAVQSTLPGSDRYAASLPPLPLAPTALPPTHAATPGSPDPIPSSGRRQEGGRMYLAGRIRTRCTGRTRASAVPATRVAHSSSRAGEYSSR